LTGLILVAYILRHNIGRVLRGALFVYIVLGAVFAGLLAAVNYEVLTTLYHLWVTILLFIVIMLVLAIGGR